MKICVIYNYAQHYRLAIFQLMNKNFDCDFYFGDKMKDVKKLDYKLLPGYQKELNNVKIFSHVYWQKGAVPLLFHKYDRYIILGDYYCLSTWTILFLSFFTRKKIYLWSHGWYGKETSLIRFVKKIFFNLCDQVFLYGNYAKDLMIAEGFKPERLHVIYNSLYYSEQLQIRSRLTKTNIYRQHFNNDHPVLLFIGRLTKEKKLEQLVLALQVLQQSNIPVNLIFIGTGEEEAFLKSKLSAIAGASYWFYGPCYDEQKIGELIHNASVCVSPGNVGLTAMHAMVFGTPVITHNEFKTQMPEFEAIIPGLTGDFFLKDNVEDLADKIKKWIAPGIDRGAVALECYKVIDEKYNPFFQVEVIREVLDKSEK